VNTARSTGI